MEKHTLMKKEQTNQKEWKQQAGAELGIIKINLALVKSRKAV